MSKKVILIDFYSDGSYGLRYLQNALEHSGYTVKIVFLKKYEESFPKKVTDLEFNLLKELLISEKPLLVGVSLLTSFYVELVEQVTNLIKELGILQVAGGIFATLSPEVAAKLADYVIRGEGEDAIVELADAIYSGGSVSQIQNLVYKNESGDLITNDMRPLLTDIDKFGFPQTDTGCEYLIDDNKLTIEDPVKNSYAYTVIGTRGCMFTCSFCGSANLRKLSTGLGSYVRKRAVSSVIEELLLAKKKLKKLVFVRFLDGVFPYDKEWVEEFAKEYKEKINLPFNIWTHPLRTDKEIIGILRKAGLYKVAMGIQSGSPTIRNEIFLRKESNEHIILASKVNAELGVPMVEYDFILCHPFETELSIKETYDLCQSLHGSFSLNINGLKFMPETPIVDIAIERGKATAEEINESIYMPIEKQFDFLRKVEKYQNHSPEMDFWYNMVCLTQFKFTKRLARKYESNPTKYAARVRKICAFIPKLKKLRKLRHHGIMYISSLFKG